MSKEIYFVVATITLINCKLILTKLSYVQILVKTGRTLIKQSADTDKGIVCHSNSQYRINLYMTFPACYLFSMIMAYTVLLRHI